MGREVSDGTNERIRQLANELAASFNITPEDAATRVRRALIEILAKPLQAVDIDPDVKGDEADG